MTSPFPYSVAGVDDTKDEWRIELKFSDSGFNQLLASKMDMGKLAGLK